MNKIEIAEDFHNIIGRSNYLHVATAIRHALELSKVPR